MKKKDNSPMLMNGGETQILTKQDLNQIQAAISEVFMSPERSQTSTLKNQLKTEDEKK
jgi:hypothetical protein